MKENLSDDMRATRRLLHEISQLCEHASLTGSLSGGAKRTVIRYNAILTKLIEEDAIPGGLFEPLPENSEYGEVGAEARMLGSYLRDGEKDKEHRRREVGDAGVLMRLAPFIDKHDLSALLKEQLNNGAHFDMGIMTALAPFLAKEDLGKLLRMHMSGMEGFGRPDWPQGRGRADREQRDRDRERAREERDRERERERENRRDRDEDEEGEERRGPDFPTGLGWPFTNDQNPPPAPSSLDDALEQLRNPDLSSEDRDRLIRQVRELATE